MGKNYIRPLLHCLIVSLLSLTGVSLPTMKQCDNKTIEFIYRYNTDIYIKILLTITSKYAIFSM